MSSLNAYLGRERVEASLPGVERIYVDVVCLGSWVEEVYNTIGDFMAAAVTPRVVASVRHAATAGLTAFATRLKGYGVARKPGIEIVLALLGQRNISKALSIAAPRSHEKAVLIAVSVDPKQLDSIVDSVGGLTGYTTCRLDPVEACRLIIGGVGCNDPAMAERLVVTNTALYPITTRVGRSGG